MTTVPNYEQNDKIRIHICNCSDDKLLFNELYLKFLSLKSQKMTLCKVRQNLLTVNAKNENISKSLLKIKTDYEGHIFFLNKTLYNLRLSTNKQKILLKKKLDYFYSKRKAFEEYYKLSPIKCELEDLINKNKSLEEELKNKIDWFELTKKQYYKLSSLIIEAFKRKVCEFCDAILTQELNNHKSQ